MRVYCLIIIFIFLIIQILSVGTLVLIFTFFSFLEVNPVDLKLSVNHHVVENNNVVTLYGHQDKTWQGVAIQC